MTKKLKAAIFAAAFISLGGAAYTYDRYGVQDNSTLLANIEAMSCNNEENKENSEGGNGSSSGGGSNEYSRCASYIIEKDLHAGYWASCGSYLQGCSSMMNYNQAINATTPNVYLWSGCTYLDPSKKGDNDYYYGLASGQHDPRDI